MGSQLELNSERGKQLDKAKKVLHEFMVPEHAAWDVAYKEGALSSKVKRLIALGIACRAACVNCVLGQTMSALEAGATRDEIIETIYVVGAICGSSGIAESFRVIELLDELGKL
jgi:AhpD family alkylhydroperoxidase